MASKKSLYPRVRQMWFSTNCYGLDGKEILIERVAKDICESHLRSLESYGLIVHDNDKHDETSIQERDSRRKQLYMELYKKYASEHGIPEDISSESGYAYDAICVAYAKSWAEYYYPVRKVGDSKELHIHVALKFKSARALDEIARWFGIPVSMIEILKGASAMKEAYMYLIHQKQPEKAQYSPEKVISSFDYVGWLDNQIVKDALHDKYHMSVDDLNDIVNDVATKGLSLRKAEEMVSAPVYLRNAKLFRDARAKYVYEHIAMPAPRLVFYVDGDGKAGRGKSVCTRALCKQLAKEYGADISKPMDQLKDYIYKTGQRGVAWDKYDGQPIVYIDDRDAGAMLREFGNHEGVKNLFEMFPEKETTSVKFSTVSIVAKYIVINGIQSYDEFVNGLNGTYTTSAGVVIESDGDITQYTRRIQGIIKLEENEIVSMLFNKGVWLDTNEYTEYITIKTMKHNFMNSVKRLSGNALVAVEERTMRPMIEVVSEVNKRVGTKIENPSDIPQEFWDYGTEIQSADTRNFVIKKQSK